LNGISASAPAAQKAAQYSAAKREFQECDAAEDPDSIVCLQLSPLPHTYTEAAALPLNWDWRRANGINYVVPTLNQHLPKYCGACWIFATVHALSDRIKIARNAMTPEITLSPQVMLNCGLKLATLPWEHMNCKGGTSSKAYKYMKEYGLPDTTCAPYEAHTEKCDEFHKCYNCVHNTTCYAVKDYTTYKLKEYGVVSGEHQMMAEIYRRGPITCKTAVADAMFDYTGGIYRDDTGEMRIRHAVEVVGFGATSNGTKYWIVRNSWGTYWGENGFYRLVRGENQLNMEQSGCMWGIPEWEEKRLETGVENEMQQVQQVQQVQQTNVQADEMNEDLTSLLVAEVQTPLH